jgi:hypothetical protein
MHYATEQEVARSNRAGPIIANSLPRLGLGSSAGFLSFGHYALGVKLECQTTQSLRRGRGRERCPLREGGAFGGFVPA